MFAYTLGDPDYFTPLERTLQVDPSATKFAATGLPEGWECTDLGIWVRWLPVGQPIPQQGWKVHVAAKFTDARQVLQIVADTCADLGVGFKHLASERIYLWMHHKHGPRTQSGKFCALYPADVDTCRQLMERLTVALGRYEGTYVLTDRRFGRSKSVSYRFGGFTGPSRVRPDGSHQTMILDEAGTEIADVRKPYFQLPGGVTDPFVGSEEGDADDDTLDLNGYVVTSVLRHSNGGGAYRAQAPDGRTVFIKEARSANGYHWDRSTAQERLRHEYEVLTHLAEILPGVAPRPIDYFAIWEHEFMVTEFVTGESLWAWMAANNPIITPEPGPEKVHAYFSECQRVLDLLGGQLRDLHDHGFCFGDLNPRNVLLADSGPRLIDFEAAGRVGAPRYRVGTSGYVPPAPLDESADPRDGDEYALSAVALTLISPLLAVLQRNPNAAEHLLFDVRRVGEVPARLWGMATRHLGDRGERELPRPDEVAADPQAAIDALRRSTAAGLLAMAQDMSGYPDNPQFPMSAWGWFTNKVCVAHGTAGVLHALRVAGEPIDPAMLERFRRECVDNRDALAPGLLSGSAGVAWVLADLGLLDEAADLLRAALTHPITGTNATLGEGAAGVATACLAMYAHTRDERYRTDAYALLDALPSDHDMTSHLGANDACGWRCGRIGIAHALYYGGRLCSDPRLLERGRRLLHHELGRAVAGDGGGLLFPVSGKDRRIEPYLGVGSAGFAFVARRYLHWFDDDVLAEGLRECLRSCTVPMSVSAGLFSGTAGLGFALADAGHAGAADLLAAGYAVGQAMFKYAVPNGPGQVRYLSGIDARYRGDLAGGSAGILLFLASLRSDLDDAMFTLDRQLRPSAPTSRVPDSAAHVSAAPTSTMERR